MLTPLLDALSTAPVAVFSVSGVAFPTMNDVVDSTKRHWGNYAKLKASFTGAVSLTARPAWRGKPPIDYPVLAVFTWHVKGSRKDADNVAFGKKYVLDGLQAAGVLKNDGPKIVCALADVFDQNGTGVTVAIYRFQP